MRRELPGQRALPMLADLGYWPRQYALGLFRLWQFNGPWLAVRLTCCNLFGVRRQFSLRLFGFDLVLRSGTPDLAVALDSLGPEFEPVLGLTDPAGLIVDAGGYIGTAAMRLARAFPASTVLSIEPSSENLELLRRNVAGFANVIVRQAALAAEPGTVDLTDPGAGHWGFTIAAQPGPARPTVETVAAISMADVLAETGHDRIFILKLDVEGAERDILASSGGWMGRTAIVIAELHEHLLPGCAGAFAAATAGRRNRRLPGEKWLSTQA